MSEGNGHRLSVMVTRMRAIPYSEQIAATIGPAAIFSIDCLTFFGQDVFYFGPLLVPYGPLLPSFRSQIDPPNLISTESHQFSNISDDFMTFSFFGHRPRRYLLQPLSIRSAGYMCLFIFYTRWRQVEIPPSYWLDIYSNYKLDISRSRASSQQIACCRAHHEYSTIQL